MPDLNTKLGPFSRKQWLIMGGGVILAGGAIYYFRKSHATPADATTANDPSTTDPTAYGYNNYPPDPGQGMYPSSPSDPQQVIITIREQLRHARDPNPRHRRCRKGTVRRGGRCVKVGGRHPSTANALGS